MVSKNTDASDIIHHDSQVQQLPREELMSAASMSPVATTCWNGGVFVLMFFVCVHKTQ